MGVESWGAGVDHGGKAYLMIGKEGGQVVPENHAYYRHCHSHDDNKSRLSDPCYIRARGTLSPIDISAYVLYARIPRDKDIDSFLTGLR